jgi:hypothetical protein
MLREREPLPTVILMDVANPRAPHYGDRGRIVEILREADEQQEMTYIKLEFEDGSTQAYERTELELVMP